jgi:Cdc6-like AAA superfamily ATPase/predicted Ser/Thr protein kinase
MLRCYHCGTDNLDGTEYCDECGTRLSVPASPQPAQPPNAQHHNIVKKQSWPVRTIIFVVTLLILPFYLLFLASRELVKKALAVGRNTSSSQAISRPASPFAANFERYETTIPLTKSFLYGHEPVGTNDELVGASDASVGANVATRFVGRQSELNVLAQRILFSNGGSFLVTGYRGVGKTSFINQVVRKLNESLPWAKEYLKVQDIEIIDIYLNIARPVQPAELMHYIIRQLYDCLVKKRIYQLLDDDLRDELTLAYQRTSVNMARKVAEAAERSFGFNEASLGGEFLKATVKASWVAKRSRTQNYEMTFLSYDDKAAEQDIINIAGRLTKGYVRPITRLDSVRRIFNPTERQRVKLKIVFVFDELDKLEEFTTKVEGKGGEEQNPVIDVIIGTLKNLFTTSGLAFVFVAGKDLQERWLEDVGKGDSVYESVFSYDKYLPCLWADVDSICDGFVDTSQIVSKQKYEVFKEFKKYLAYKGRGIPRRIIRTFNEYVEWDSNQPVLAFTKQNVRRIRFFAGLQDVLTAHEDRLFGDSHVEVLGTHSDKRRLGVYYLVDWILRQGPAEFTHKDVLNASERLSVKIALAQKIAPGVATDIIKILLDADYLQEVQKPLDRVVIGDANVEEEKRYKLAPRRLVEMGGSAVDAEVDAVFNLPTETLFATRDQHLTSIGKYKIIRTIGKGGMGTVYQATDEYSGRNVAIKVPSESLATNADMLARFEREAMIMEELNHPNIVRSYEWGRDNGKLYLAMEYLDGLTLEEVIHRQGKLSLSLVIAIAKPVAEALEYVHQKGFVRNDIKPANVMLTTGGRVCLLDFGVTKPINPKPEMQSKFDTGFTVIIGTPQFMAPEQFHGISDARSDIFSFGVMLYRMLTDVFPFDRSHFREPTEEGAKQAPDPLSQRVSLPAAIDKVVLKCLEKNPAERFQTMTELIQTLTTAAGTLPHVDLKAVVGEVQEEAKEVEAMNRQVTANSELPVPALGRGSQMMMPSI